MKTEVEVITCAGIVTIYLLYSSIDLARLTTTAQHKARAAYIRSIMALCWPVILLNTVPQDDITNPLLLVPLCWNVCLWAIDMYLMHFTSSKDGGNPSSIRLDPTNVTALGFALSGLVGNRPNTRYSYIFVCAIVCCMVVVLPSHNMNPTTTEAQLFESIQKGTLMWCIGLVITGVVLMTEKNNITATTEAKA